ncbi:MAG: glycine cleavage system protein GcvH [Acidimicrobiia bacterium]|nr:glycine cleavage system protein GcvH [Acidimicrobiia bacterium]
MQIPEDLRYSSDHEWIRLEEGNRARIGITDFAQDALGDVVYVDLPEVGRVVAGGESVSEVESTKSVSDIYAPISGEVVEVNSDLVDAPDKLNSDPYGEGWILVIELSSEANLDNLLDAPAYIELTEA